MRSTRCPGKEVRVEGKRRPGGLTLDISNLGIGISEQHKEQIFERYWRTPEAMAHAQEGSGIGLTIVKAFVDSCGGTIKVTSVPVGATGDFLSIFSLTFPEWR